MLIQSKRVTVVKINKPERELNQELQWFGSSLGLFNLRDKDKSCFRIFIELIKAAKQRQPLSSDEIAFKLDLTRGTVVHHLNKLMESGLVVTNSKRYMLRVENLSSLVEELQRDIHRACEDLMEVALNIDNSMGL